MSERPAIPAEIARQILLECRHRCAVCGNPTPLERAHIIPWHKSKEHKAEDLICLCANCHERADKEKWGEKMLREYKKKPWVMLRYKEEEHTNLYMMYKGIRRSGPWVRLFLLIALVTLSWGAVEIALWGSPKMISIFTGTPPVAVRYPFETGEMGWVAQDKPGSHAIRYVFQARDTSKTGGHSLGANVRLVGGDANLDEGEVYVNMLRTPPEGITAPVNLESIQLSMWVYIPENVVVGDKVGGIQLFLKDVRWKSLYGRYVDLSPRAKIGYWFVLTLVPGKYPSQFGGYQDPEFNPREIIAIGLRIDACGEEGCIYEGNIFIDDVTW